MKACHRMLMAAVMALTMNGIVYAGSRVLITPAVLATTSEEILCQVINSGPKTALVDAATSTGGPPMSLGSPVPVAPGEMSNKVFIPSSTTRRFCVFTILQGRTKGIIATIQLQDAATKVPFVVLPAQ